MEEFKKPLLPIAGNSKSQKLFNDVNNTNWKSRVKTAENQELNTTIEGLLPQNCPYIVPSWSSQPKHDVFYSLEVLKAGRIIDEIQDLQLKSYWTFGRFNENDVEMAHPTTSRYHAVLQYGYKNTMSLTSDDKEEFKDDERPDTQKGWYIYDLDSTHGTFLNKRQVPPKVYIRIRVGHILRFGASTRSYILQGPEDDEEPESELSVSELKLKRQQELEEAALRHKRLEEELAESARNEECSWGMADDADEESDLTHNPYASTNNEDLFLDDPKKTLRGYFEREGLQLEYKCDEMSAGSFVCRVELPLDNENGRPIIAEVVHKGKKKDCVVQCALEACRILDRHGVLRQAHQEPLKRKQKREESDSDDDEFWDRTGDVAKKKQRKANCTTNVTLTYEDLLKQESELNKELQDVVSHITDYQEQQKQSKSQKPVEEGDDDLDNFMEILKAKENPIDKTEIKKLRLKEQGIKSEIQRTQRLIEIAKPVEIKLIKNPLNDDHLAHKSGETVSKTRQLPMIGKRNQFSKFKILTHSTTTNVPSSSKLEVDSSEEELKDSNEVSGTETGNRPDILEGKSDELCGKTANENVLGAASSTNSPKRTEIDVNSATKETREVIEDISENKTKVEKNSTETQLTELSKKRRNRVRQRGKRQDADKEDEEQYESSEKYAKWLPPENQTGDGFTELNKKFGY